MGEILRSPQISLSPQQLQEGSIYLGQVFFGLAALVQLNSGSLAKTMATLQSEILDPYPSNANSGMNFGMNINGIDSTGINLDFSQLSDRLLSPSNPLWQPLNAPELAFSIQVLVHLCQQHQELIRRAVSLMEQITKEGKDPWQITLLKDYSQRSTAYSSPSLPASPWWNLINGGARSSLICYFIVLPMGSRVCGSGVLNLLV